MSTQETAKIDTKSKVPLNDKVTSFLQKWKTGILVGLIVVLANLTIAGAIIFYLDYSAKKNYATVEQLTAEYDELVAMENNASKDEKSAELFKKLAVAGKLRGNAGAKALTVTGKMYADNQDWANAEKAWLEAVKVAPKSYLAGSALYNAAAANEELGDKKKAIVLYTRCTEEYKDSFPLVSRAYFAIGRVNEDLLDFAGAIQAYKKLTEQAAQNNWTKLAQGRILALSIKTAAH